MYKWNLRKNATSLFKLRFGCSEIGKERKWVRDRYSKSMMIHFYNNTVSRANKKNNTKIYNVLSNIINVLSPQ